MKHTPQAGARHCADVNGTFCMEVRGDEAPAHCEPSTPTAEPATAPHFKRRMYGYIELPVFPLSEIIRGVLPA